MIVVVFVPLEWRYHQATDLPCKHTYYVIRLNPPIMMYPIMLTIKQDLPSMYHAGNVMYINGYRFESSRNEYGGNLTNEVLNRLSEPIPMV
jgi:hypothetical protein